MVLNQDMSEEAQSLAGGIVLSHADQAARNLEYRLGDVVGVGIGEHPPVQVGDRVLWRKFTGTEAEIDGDQYTILGFDEILGVVEK